MSTPRRIQLRRAKGWRKPPGTVVVARPTRWGNPFSIEACLDAGFATDTEGARALCVQAFRDWLKGDAWAAGVSPDWFTRRRAILNNVHELRGKNLACWCRLCEKHRDGKPLGVECPDCAPCHADILLEVANG